MNLFNGSTKLGIVCHDAGAANQLLWFLKAQKNKQLIGLFDGPAALIQRRLLPNLNELIDIKTLISSCDVVISGTGWGSNLEYVARAFAKDQNKHSIAVLDHWVNYEQRFIRNGETILPDEIWVFDKYAQSKAKTIFPDVKVKKQFSYYEKFILRQVSNTPIETNTLLYICEPIRLNNGVNEIIELQILHEFLENISVRSEKLYQTIYLRMHPSEKSDKYDKIIGEFANLNLIKDKNDLGVSIGKASCVAGHSSYALYLASLAGRRVISAIGNKTLSSSSFDLRDIINMENL